MTLMHESRNVPGFGEVNQARHAMNFHRLSYQLHPQEFMTLVWINNFSINFKVTDQFTGLSRSDPREIAINIQHSFLVWLTAYINSRKQQITQSFSPFLIYLQIICFLPFASPHIWPVDRKSFALRMTAKAFDGSFELFASKLFALHCALNDRSERLRERFNLKSESCEFM